MQMLQIYHHYRHHYIYVCLFCVVQCEDQNYHLIKSNRVKYISGFAFIECTIVWIPLIPLHEQMPKKNDWDPTNV